MMASDMWLTLFLGRLLLIYVVKILCLKVHNYRQDALGPMSRLGSMGLGKSQPVVKYWAKLNLSAEVAFETGQLDQFQDLTQQYDNRIVR